MPVLVDIIKNTLYFTLMRMRGISRNRGAKSQRIGLQKNVISEQTIIASVFSGKQYSADILRRRFAADGGQYYRRMPTEEEKAASLQVSDYLYGDIPEISLHENACDMTLVHEWRHHDQIKLLGKDYGGRSCMSKHPLLDIWIEADARANEALHLLEKFALQRKATQRHHLNPGKLDDYCPGLSAVFNRAVARPVITRQDKLQVMRYAFDSFVHHSRKNADQHYYRQQQEQYVSKQNPLKSGFSIVLFLVGAIPNILIGSFSPFNAVAGYLAVGMALYTAKEKLSHAFNHAGQITKEEGAYILEKLGTLPDRSGNYLTETTSHRLDSDFYFALPERLEKLAAEKRREFIDSTIPFMTSARKIARALTPS